MFGPAITLKRPIRDPVVSLYFPYIATTVQGPLILMLEAFRACHPRGATNSGFAALGVLLAAGLADGDGLVDGAIFTDGATLGDGAMLGLAMGDGVVVTSCATRRRTESMKTHSSEKGECAPLSLRGATLLLGSYSSNGLLDRNKRDVALTRGNADRICETE